MTPRAVKDGFLSSRVRSFGAAFNGISVALRTQPNAWIHAVATAGVIAAGLILEVSTEDWRWLIASIAAVWAAELFNTALEWVTDLASSNVHPLAGKAKDAAAGAVLVAAIGAACVGVSIFGPRIAGLLSR